MPELPEDIKARIHDYASKMDIPFEEVEHVILEYASDKPRMTALLRGMEWAQSTFMQHLSKAMRWRKERPEAGWWWFRNAAAGQPEAEIVRIDPVSKKILWDAHTHDFDAIPFDGAEWSRVVGPPPN